MNSKPSKEYKFKSNAVRVLMLVLAVFMALIAPGALAQDRINPVANYQPGFIRGTTQSINSRVSPAPPAPEQGQWMDKAPLPIPRTEMWYRDRIFVFGGEGNGDVYAQVEAYDPTTNSWQSYTPMKTPRHGMGAVVVGDVVYIAGGGPVTGGSLMTSTNQAFTLSPRRR